MESNYITWDQIVNNATLSLVRPVLVQWAIVVLHIPEMSVLARALVIGLMVSWFFLSTLLANGGVQT